MALRLPIASALAVFVLAVLVPPAAAERLGAGVAVDQPPAAAKRATATTEGPCPIDVPLSAPAAVQEQAMLCLTNLARERAGEPALEPLADLEWSAAEKAGDVLGCDEFSHSACGRDFDYWLGQAGYLSARCWRVGENLAWGSGSYGTVASIFRAWMRSPAHRENVLGDYTQVGIDLEVGKLGGFSGARVWTQHFGSTACPE